jgi:16S rRNA (cytosine967-C5)-methyltransferase
MNVRFPFQKIDPSVLNILRIALYQVFFMDRVPESAAVNEAVKQARALGSSHVAGFVNGILRHICRTRDEISYPDRHSNLPQYLSVFYSYPRWLVEKWIRELGSGFVEPLLAAGNSPPVLVVRANGLKIDRTGLINRLKKEGVAGRPTTYSPEGIEMSGMKGRVDRMASFREGLFQVQGEAAQICGYLISPEKGKNILDICAGLGGKSTHMAWLMENKGRVVALDINHSRLVSLSKSSRRLGIDCIDPVVSDAGEDLPYLFSHSFDTILIDGPCSGLGVISKNPDAKWAKDASDIERLSLLQLKILIHAAPLLRRGGKMLYVTCTISKEENDGVVSDFLGQNKGMSLVNLKKHVPHWGFDLIDDEGFLRTFPHIHGMDGFFGAMFVKR